MISSDLSEIAIPSKNLAAILISLAVCTYSRSHSTSAWNSARRKNKYNTDLPWDLLLRKRDHVKYHQANTEECCPSITQIVQPMGGVAKSGRILELYRDLNSTQSFYQTSCRRGVRGHPCQYIDDIQRKHSICVQRYSYTYALVREFNSDAPWRLDYIRVRTGCSCEIRLKKLRPYRRKTKRIEDFLETQTEFE